MKNRLTQNWALGKELRFFFIVVLILGIFFRLVNLDRKVYWIDETYTSLRVSGYTETEVVQQISNQQTFGIKDLQKYQQIDAEKSVIDTIKGLAQEEPQLPPLYFIMARFWAQTWGNSVAVMRSLPAVINLLAFPYIMWLCLELFESSLTGWVAIAIFAVSPFQVLYAQEARPYSLFAVTILLSSASLLRAMRLNTWRSWAIYTATIVLGLYSYLYFALIAIGHGIYVLAIEGLRLKKIKAYLLASIAGFIPFSPWIIALITNWGNVSNKTAWQNPEVPQPISVLARFWISNLSRVFIDFGLVEDLPKILALVLRASNLILLILLGYSIYFICRNTPKRVWIFILTLTFPTALFLVLPDLISGGLRSTVTRYLVPFYLGIELAVAHLLATKIASTSLKNQNWLWRLVTITLLSFGVISCVISSQAQTWYTKYTNYDNPQIARIINSAAQPLVLADTKDQAGLINFNKLGTLMSISYLLEPKVKALVGEPNLPKIPDSFSDVFLVQKPSKRLKAQIEQSYKIKPIYRNNYGDIQLWKLEK